MCSESIFMAILPITEIFLFFQQSYFYQNTNVNLMVVLEEELEKKQRITEVFRIHPLGTEHDWSKSPGNPDSSSG